MGVVVSDLQAIGFLRSMEDMARAVAKREIADAPTDALLATVVGLDPLQLLGDGDIVIEEPLIGTSDPITEGARVVVTWAGKRAVIIGAAHTAPPPVTVLRMGQWNIRYAADSPPERPWASRKPLLAQTVVDSGVDVLTVQEASWVGMANDQAADLAAAIQARAGTGADWVSLNAGVVASSGFSILVNRALWEPTGESGRWRSRPLIGDAMWVMLRNRATGARVIVASDHWHPGDPAVRLREAKTAHAVLLDVHRRTGATAILGADTNDYGATYGQDIAAMNGGGAFRDLKTAYPAVSRSEWPTWHDWIANPPWPQEGQSLGEWLDTIFVTADATVTAGGIYDTALPLTTALASDHHFLTATITIRDTHRDAPYDTGWIDARAYLASGWTSPDGYEVSYRIIDGIVQWRGWVQRASKIASGNILEGLPAQVFPAAEYPVPIGHNTAAGALSGGFFPDAGGSLYVWAAHLTTAGLTSCYIGGSYPIG